MHVYGMTIGGGCALPGGMWLRDRGRTRLARHVARANSPRHRTDIGQPNTELRKQLGRSRLRFERSPKGVAG